MIPFILLPTVQFEGSLGRLTSSSVHNPRQIIDVDAKVIQSDEDPKARELRKFKQLLIHVEKVGIYFERIRGQFT